MNWRQAIWVAALSTAGVLMPALLNAQTENVAPPARATTWHYLCKTGDCPTKCSVSGTELFSTGSYLALIVTQLPNRSYWISIDTGQKEINYIGSGADQMACIIAGATLQSFRAAEPPNKGSDQRP
jgi:hypothetical protein